MRTGVTEKAPAWRMGEAKASAASASTARYAEVIRSRSMDVRVPSGRSFPQSEADQQCRQQDPVAGVVNARSYDHAGAGVAEFSATEAIGRSDLVARPELVEESGVAYPQERLRGIGVDADELIGRADHLHDGVGPRAQGLADGDLLRGGQRVVQRDADVERRAGGVRPSRRRNQRGQQCAGACKPAAAMRALHLTASVGNSERTLLVRRGRVGAERGRA